MRTAAEEKLLIELRRIAMNLLARREHSRSELIEKLQRKVAEHARHFPEVLDQLEQDGLQSDERFAEVYVHYRRSRGFGPLLIRQELRGKRIDALLLESVIDIRAEQWLDTLRELISKKRRLNGTPMDEPLNQSTDHSRASSLLQRRGSADVQRIGTTSIDDVRKAHQKLYRFCLSRGFTSEQIERAMR